MGVASSCIPPIYLSRPSYERVRLEPPSSPARPDDASIDSLLPDIRLESSSSDEDSDFEVIPIIPVSSVVARR